MIQYCPSNHNPYDDEPDYIAESEKFLQDMKNQDGDFTHKDFEFALQIIEALLDIIEEEGIR